MLAIKSKLDKLNSRLTTLSNKNNKIIVEYYLDLESEDANIWFIVKVVDRLNKTIESTSKLGTTGDNSLKNNIHKYLNKYNCCIEWLFYNVINGIPTLTTPLIN